MSYETTVQAEKDYLRVEVSGIRVPGQEAEDGIAVWTRVADVCREHKVDKILAIINLEGHLPTSVSFKIANDPYEFGWEKRFRVAVVDVNYESRLVNYLTEAVAVNRGYDVRIFENEQSAMDWLFRNQDD